MPIAAPALSVQYGGDGNNGPSAGNLSLTKPKPKAHKKHKKHKKHRKHKPTKKKKK